jgi:signal transduction histidine kinase
MDQAKEGLIREINILRQKLAEFAKLETEYNKAKDEVKKDYIIEVEKEVADRTRKLQERTSELEMKEAELARSQKAMLFMVEDLNRQAKELKDAQEKIVRSEKLAAIGQLASSVAHEIRNPLGVIKNAVYYFNMLGLGKDNPEIKENLAIISQEIEISDRIISDLLEFSRVKKPDLRPENINMIIEEILRRLKAKISPGIEIATELSGNLPEVEVDALQIQQIFSNVALNALQAMEKGGKLTIISREQNGFVEIAFKDTGCGIPKENLAKIFEPLFSTKAKGTGLGLSVCRSLVEGHNGKIEVESEAGKGTTFRVKLPIKRR